MDIYTMTCGKCGYESDFDKWTVSVLNQPAAPGSYQCPKCGHAFKTVKAKDKYGWPKMEIQNNQPELSMI